MIKHLCSFKYYIAKNGMYFFSFFLLPNLKIMTQLVWLLSDCIRSRLATCCVLGFWLTTTSVALAEYQPPPDQKPPSTYTQSTGSRGGCEVNKETSIATLAPQKHIGQTALERPTFAWFVPDSKPYPLEFTLYKYAPGGAIQLAYKTQLKSSPGIMKLSLPQKNPGLVFGQRYIWQVAILCDPNHPSSDVVAKAEIELVKMPSTLAKEMFGVRDTSQKIDLLAKAGLWYDSLGEALTAKDVGLRKLAVTLLKNLAQLEEQQATQANNTQTINLLQIAISSEEQPKLPSSQ